MSVSHSAFDLKQYLQAEYKDFDPFFTILGNCNQKYIQSFIKESEEDKNLLKKVVYGLVIEGFQKICSLFSERKWNLVFLQLSKLNQIAYLFNFFPNEGMLAMDCSISFQNILSKKKTLQAIDGAIMVELYKFVRFVLSVAPHISIPQCKGLCYLIDNAAKAKDIYDRDTRKLLEEFLQKRVDDLFPAIVLNGSDRAALPLQAKINSFSSEMYFAPLVAELKKQVDPNVANPFVRVWENIIERLIKEAQKKCLSTATREILVTFMELSRALFNKNTDLAIKIILAGIQINSESSLFSKTRAMLLTLLILPFTTFPSSLSQNQIQFASFFHLELANRYFEIGDYLLRNFDLFQKFLEKRPAEHAIYAELLITPIMIKNPSECKPQLNPHPTNCVVLTRANGRRYDDFFGLNRRTPGATRWLDEDPDPDEVTKPGI